MRVLLVEDEAALAQPLKQTLTEAGYAVDWVDNGRDAWALGGAQTFDAVVLDLGLPQMDGLSVLKRWRSEGMAAPVLILTARDQWHEKVAGIDAGADDYLTKPFHTEELLARIAAVLKRSAAVATPGPLARGALRLDEGTQSATLDGAHISLSGIEFRLLRCFMLNAGQVLSQQRLGEHLYDHGAEHDSNVIEAHITRLRRKIGRDWIRTRRGQGYVFGEPEGTA